MCDGWMCVQYSKAVRYGWICLQRQGRIFFCFWLGGEVFQGGMLSGKYGVDVFSFTCLSDLF